MHDWNVVITVHEEGFKRTCALLDSFGPIAGTHYHNVLVMKVADTGAFLERLGALVTNAPEVLKLISRAVPAAHAFDFADAAAFEAGAREITIGWLPRLADKSFYVRLHRRGLKGKLQTPMEEQFLDEVLLEALAAAGTPGRISFENPDIVIDIETIDNRAGLSIWTRDELERYTFLKID